MHIILKPSPEKSRDSLAHLMLRHFATHVSYVATLCAHISYVATLCAHISYVAILCDPN